MTTDYDHHLEMAHKIIATAMAILEQTHTDRIAYCQMAAQSLLEAVHASVLEAREDGWSWAEVGSVTGVAPKEAERRHGQHCAGYDRFARGWFF